MAEMNMDSIRVYVIPRHGVVLRVTRAEEDIYHGRITRNQALAMLIELATAIQRDEAGHDLFAEKAG